MSPLWIEVDDEVVELVKGAAEPFVDIPNRALRRLLGLAVEKGAPTAPLPSSDPRQQRRAPSSAILPMAEYELPILRAISQAGGTAPRGSVLDAVESMLADRLTGLDRERLNSGEVRWRARTNGCRVKLVERALLAANSPRGVWQLTQAGIEELSRLDARDRSGEEVAR